MARVADAVRADERGLSTAVGYALNIAIAALLLSTLLVAAGGVVEDQRERVARDELAVVGERLASDLHTADRLAANGSTVLVRSQLPDRVAGVGYHIEIGSSGKLTLVTSGPAVSVSVPVELDTPVESADVVGGRLTIELDGDSLEVRRRA